MNDIISKSGEYLQTSFKGNNGIWHLVSTECDDINAKATECIDTFKNKETGLFKPIPRAKVFSQAEAGIIKPINNESKQSQKIVINTLF